MGTLLTTRRSQSPRSHRGGAFLPLIPLSRARFFDRFRLALFERVMTTAVKFRFRQIAQGKVPILVLFSPSSLLVRFLPTSSVMPWHLSRNANVFPRHKLFLLSCQLCFSTVCALVHDLLRSDVHITSHHITS